ncbi:MAG TPA: hypothetical protein DIT09_10825 [Glutamicibacter sp.]|nr:hypothetical protein [Glutamicibacter sp.]
MQQADQVFAETIANAPADSLSSTEDSKCFYEKGEGDDITQVAHCGPVKILGKESNWLPISFETKIDSDSQKILSEPMLSESASNPSGELFRPDGDKPADAESVAQPVGPQTTQKNFAAVVPLDSLRSPLNFEEELEKPSVLKAPAANVSITQKAKDQLVPGEVIKSLVGGTSSSSASAEGNLEFYRPAEGQTLSMYKVSISAPDELSPELAAGWIQPKDAKDAGLSLSVKSGSQRLNIVGSLATATSYASNNSDTATISCSAVPCESRDGKDYLLVVSSEDSSEPSLVGTTDGKDQTVSLSSGEVTSSVSSVAYERDRLRQQVSAAWGTQTEEIVNQKTVGEKGEPVSLTFGGSIGSAYLTPFETTNGWAAEGKAWLVMQVDDMQIDSGTFSTDPSVDWPKSWIAKTDKDTFNAQPEGFSDRAVFEVPAELKKANVAFQPTGVVKYKFMDGDYNVDRKQKAFTVKEALKVEVEIP